MLYKIVLKTEADEELAELSNRERLLVFKQLKKIATSPELGQILGNKAGLNLSGCRKMYADKKRIRIVYTILEDKIIIEVIAIGKRDELEVYKKASQRME
ncbi:MAG: type II toxin-antitoxin system RelE/ParE family toxin [Campylobacterales bacterium]|nr:type II toxin-antitoxin system RelE/ParE family toxin [Campylobacterales bacterium]